MKSKATFFLFFFFFLFRIYSQESTIQNEYLCLISPIDSISLSSTIQLDSILNQLDSIEYVFDYYNNGFIKKIVAKCVESPSMCGQFISFFQNGQVKLIGRYEPVSGMCSRDSIIAETVEIGTFIHFERKIGTWIEFDETGRILELIQY